MLNVKTVNLENSVVNVNSLKTYLNINLQYGKHYILYKNMLHEVTQCDDSYAITTYDLKLRVYCETTYFDDLQTIADCLNEM